MSILAAMQSAAIRLMGQRPPAFFGGSGLEMEIADLVNEVAHDIAQYQDWQALVRVGTVTGDGTTTAFSLPEDYGRMMLNTSLQDLDSWFWGYGAFTDINSFLLSSASGFNPAPGGWIIYGDEIRFSPAPANGTTATFPYITKEWATAENLAPKAAFTADTDNFLLEDRLLTLGLVWRWRENKKLDASGDQEAFVKALDEYASKDRGARVIRQSSRRGFPGTRLGWPWELGPSTYVDS